MKFYFTYGTDKQPFYGGWTEVEATNKEMAITAFRTYHPDRAEGFVNCASIYDANSFAKTTMYEEGNFGYRCWERICITVERFVAPDNVEIVGSKTMKEVKKLFKNSMHLEELR